MSLDDSQPGGAVMHFLLEHGGAQAGTRAMDPVTWSLSLLIIILLACLALLALELSTPRAYRDHPHYFRRWHVIGYNIHGYEEVTVRFWTRKGAQDYLHQEWIASMRERAKGGAPKLVCFEAWDRREGEQVAVRMVTLPRIEGKS